MIGRVINPKNSEIVRCCDKELENFSVIVDENIDYINLIEIRDGIVVSCIKEYLDNILDNNKLFEKFTINLDKIDNEYYRIEFKEK